MTSRIALALTFVGLWADCAALAQTAARDYPVRPVPFTSVRITDTFWAPRMETNRRVTIPFAFQKSEETGRVENFVRAAKVLRGEPLDNRKPPAYPFDDSDVFKIIEGAAFALSLQPDARLESYVDDLIAKIAAAQEPDGYLYTTRTIDPANPHPWAGKRRWELESADSHELYNIGHLYEAATAYYQATGKRALLDVAIRSANLLDRTFGPGKATIFPGHQVTEMGLAKLYRATGDARYLAQAKFLLDSRGPDGRPGAGRTYNQSHIKVTDQRDAVGHAVRAMYLYSGMADVAALTGDESYVKAIDRIWENTAKEKLYITGGLGATASEEAFGAGYELPNLTAYAETCAAVGNDFWNHRLFLLHADARYIDVLERALYNGLISGVSLDGATFFYANPLESAGQHQRSPWFGVACCPSNITRFVASLPGYVYGQRDSAVWVNLYVSSTADVRIGGGRGVRLTQSTRYPWDGKVRIEVAPDRPGELTIHVRIPGWARGEASPGGLYRFADGKTAPARVSVNGRPQAMKLDKGYLPLSRTWNKGDVIELDLPMPVRRVAADPRAAADRGRVALQRGPIVYAAEWPDNPNGRVRNLMLPPGAKLSAEWRPELLRGVTVVKGRAVALAYAADGGVQRTGQDFTAIPYYAWANRGKGQMVVWIPESEAHARPAPFPAIAIAALVTSSGSKDTGPIHDGEEPASSADAASYFDWWPSKGTAEWVEMAFARPAVVSECQVYWFDDTGRGGVRVPASWRLFYRDGAAWKAVETAGDYGVAKDGYNRVTFRPVNTAALRLEIRMQPGWSAGIQEWKVK